MCLLPMPRATVVLSSVTQPAMFALLFVLCCLCARTKLQVANCLLVPYADGQCPEWLSLPHSLCPNADTPGLPHPPGLPLGRKMVAGGSRYALR